MSIEGALQRVTRDIDAGDLGKARDRLHGLIAARPNDLGLRGRLGRVYWDLRHPSMAGRYWYLEEGDSPELLAAVAAFERQCGGNPVLILQALKFKGEVEAIESEFARARLLALADRARREFGYEFRTGDSRRARDSHEREGWSESLAMAGCVAVAFVAGVLLLVGFVTSVRWIFGG
jgi:hypothetical protein